MLTLIPDGNPAKSSGKPEDTEKLSRTKVAHDILAESVKVQVARFSSAPAFFRSGPAIEYGTTEINFATPK
jgi:hypothetical protein